MLDQESSHERPDHAPDGSAHGIYRQGVDHPAFAHDVKYGGAPRRVLQRAADALQQHGNENVPRRDLTGKSRKNSATPAASLIIIELIQIFFRSNRSAMIPVKGENMGRGRFSNPKTNPSMRVELVNE